MLQGIRIAKIRQGTSTTNGAQLWLQTSLCCQGWNRCCTPGYQLKILEHASDTSPSYCEKYVISTPPRAREACLPTQSFASELWTHQNFKLEQGCSQYLFLVMAIFEGPYTSSKNLRELLSEVQFANFLLWHRRLTEDVYFDPQFTTSSYWLCTVSPLSLECRRLFILWEPWSMEKQSRLTASEQRGYSILFVMSQYFPSLTETKSGPLDLWLLHKSMALWPSWWLTTSLALCRLAPTITEVESLREGSGIARFSPGSTPLVSSVP